MNLFSVKEKTILITGASRGIGKSLAIAFKDAGAIVYGTGTSDKSISWMEKEKIEGKVNNVLEEDRIRNIINEIKFKHKKLDILINNVGVSLNKPASTLTNQDIEYLIDANFKSIIRASQAFYRSHKQIGGNIINISSVLGLRGSALASVYSGTKGAIIQLTKSLVSEWTRCDFRLNVICPGFINTDMNKSMISKDSVMEIVKKKIPMGRLGRPDELIGAAIFLSSDASSYVTGQTIVIDGGMTQVI